VRDGPVLEDALDVEIKLAGYELRVDHGDPPFRPRS
jgi:hypothetical protein